MLFGCFFNSHFVFVSGKHISFLNACAFGFAVIITVNENSPLVMIAENMDTYTYWLQGFIYYDDATLAEKSKTYRKSVILF